jgi:hypothetical protein
MIEDQKYNEFEKLARPLMDWLAINHNPHVVAMITSDNAEVLEGLYNVRRPRFSEIA